MKVGHNLKESCQVQSTVVLKLLNDSTVLIRYLQWHHIADIIISNLILITIS